MHELIELYGELQTDELCDDGTDELDDASNSSQSYKGSLEHTEGEGVGEASVR